MPGRGGQTAQRPAGAALELGPGELLGRLLLPGRQHRAVEGDVLRGRRLGQAGERQVESARLALVTGYGMVLYRYGGCANAIVLEGPA